MIKKISILLLSFLAIAFTFAQTDGVIEKPNPMRLVVDQVGLLSATELQELESRLVQFADSTSNQILVVIVADLNGMEPFDYATKLGNKWGVGQAKFNNGVVLLIKPTGGQGERKVFIAPGRGLEGAIPDATCKSIVSNELLPAFKKRHFASGINDAVAVLASLALKEYSFADYNKKAKRKQYGGLIVMGVLIVIFILMNLSRRKHFEAGTSGSSLPFWATMFMFGGMGGGGNSGNWDNFSSGSGGFGGFGGGGFGGGGAGGSW